MQAILILSLCGTLLLLPGLSSAETNEECGTRCDAEKSSRDENCPPGEDTEHACARFLEESEDTYNSCIDSCPQPEPADTPSES
jgi:hypothetical protein